MPSDISDISVPQDVELEQALGNGLQLALMELDVDGLYLFTFSYRSSQGIFIFECFAKEVNSLEKMLVAAGLGLHLFCSFE